VRILTARWQDDRREIGWQALLTKARSRYREAHRNRKHLALAGALPGALAAGGRR
jgi:hypothetical protein